MSASWGCAAATHATVRCTDGGFPRVDVLVPACTRKHTVDAALHVMCRPCCEDALSTSFSPKLACPPLPPVRLSAEGCCVPAEPRMGRAACSTRGSRHTAPADYRGCEGGHRGLRLHRCCHVGVAHAVSATTQPAAARRALGHPFGPARADCLLSAATHLMVSMCG